MDLRKKNRVTTYNSEKGKRRRNRVYQWYTIKIGTTKNQLMTAGKNITGVVFDLTWLVFFIVGMEAFSSTKKRWNFWKNDQISDFFLQLLTCEKSQGIFYYEF